MKVINAVIGVLSLAYFENNAIVSVSASDHLISSWVQYTGADMDDELCTPDARARARERELNLRKGGKGKDKNGGMADTDTEADEDEPSYCHFAAEVRAIFNDTFMEMTECPTGVLTVNDADMPMMMRVNATQNFTNIVCYATLPTNEEISSIVLGGSDLPIPKYDNKNVVVIGDTGCRMGTSHKGLFQACNNPSLWPFKQIAETVAEKTDPDLIIHTGDYIYREGRCVENSEGPQKGQEIADCKDSPYYSTAAGFEKAENFDVWYADWFGPASSILKAAPLVLIRGNHEVCNRAGMGYFRYLHHGREAVCADGPNGEGTGPWIVDFMDFQIGCTDTSSIPKDPPKTSAADYNAFIQSYANDLDYLGDYFTKPALLGTHYPIYGWGTTDDDVTGDGGTQIIDEVMGYVAGNTTSGDVPSSFDLLLAAHIHLAEVTSFDNPDRPPQLVVANSGTQLIAISDPPDIISGETVKQTKVVYQYGFVFLTKMDKGDVNSPKGGGDRGGGPRGKSGKPDKKAKKEKRDRQLVGHLFGGKQSKHWWLMEFKDQVGRNLEVCGVHLKDVDCVDWDEIWYSDS